jgi:hypothetical protein
VIASSSLVCLPDDPRKMRGLLKSGDSLSALARHVPLAAQSRSASASIRSSRS